MENKKHPVIFTGTGTEYFGIWIVNILLTLVTFGIYSAWAKVRRKRYFSQNTSIDDRRFDYHATGMQILIGRIIVVVAYFLFNAVALIQPILSAVVAVVFLFAIPALLNRAMRFNARMTSWSGLRFNFEGSYWGAFRTLLLYPFLAIFTLYLALPWVARAQHRYTISAHRFGAAKFHFDSAITPFVKAFGYALLWMIGSGIVMGVVLGLPQKLMELSSLATDPSEAQMVIILAVYVAILVAILPAAFIYQAYVRNGVYAGVDLEGGHSFLSTISPAKLLWISLSNAVMVVVSFGLLIPYTAIRMYRYLTANTFLIEGGSLDDFIGTQIEEGSAVGDAFSDFEGIDIGAAI